MKKIILFSIIGACVIVGGLLYIKSSQSNQGNSVGNQNINQVTTTNSNINKGNQVQNLSDADQAGMSLSANHCTGTDKPKLTHLPMDPADFSLILPYGLMAGGHVTPVDHQYFSPTVFDSKPSTYNVYAMADSRLVALSTRQHQGQGQNKNLTVTDYRLVFSVSCRLFYYYDLVNSLAPGLEEQFNDPSNSAGVEVKSGQLIGKIGGQTLDFAVWDTDKRLTGFIVPEHYASESWKLFTADPLDYYADDIKAAALAKYARSVEPRSGKIDYDVDGKLIGNWFQKGTNGYGGARGEGNGNYWTGHLSFSPYFLDPNGFLISIGNWPDEAKQFAVQDNTPNPANVDAGSGLVKYNLVEYRDYKANGTQWDYLSIPNSAITLHQLSAIQGCILVQMTATRELKAEVFKGKKCSQVSDFSSAALTYER